MYGYRNATNDNGLMTNLNSISSSLSSIDTVGTRRTNHGNNNKASNDNLITLRSHSIASTSLLWKGGGNPKDDRYSTAASVRNASRGYPGSEIYYNGNARSLITHLCFNSETALNFILMPLLLLTIIRQVFDFLGQIWLQILINFFTIILIIVALFGIRQKRISYLGLFTLWALLNTVWNVIVLCIHTKIRDIGVNEDVLSFYTGATSWWHTNGPGCLPHRINSSIQTSLSILQPNLMTGCRLDYHHIESAQAAIHALLLFISTLICCCVMSNIRKEPGYKFRNQPKAEKLYRLNNLVSDRSKVNQDPYPNHTNSRFGGPHTASLRRPANKTSSRSSQHSVSSMRSARRRNRQDGVPPTPRGSSSSTHRSQKYGSLSSRRSNNHRRSDISSLTYGTTGDRAPVAGTSGQRTRLSSLSSVDYLPSYQPPHSSNANLLSSYGEISSIDSYNVRHSQRGSKNRQPSIKSASKGNTNPTYIGSKSSICSHNANANNYDDLSYIYGNNSINAPKTSENLYGASSSGATSSADRHRQQIYNQNRTNSLGKRNGFRNGRSQQATIHAETYQQLNSNENLKHAGSETLAKSKYGVTNGNLHSFIANNATAQQTKSSRSTHNGERQPEVNNNNLTSNYQETSDYVRGQTSTTGYLTNGASSSDYRSRVYDNANSEVNANQSNEIYTNQRHSRHPIYTNQISHGNSETPI